MYYGTSYNIICVLFYLSRVVSIATKIAAPTFLEVEDTIIRTWFHILLTDLLLHKTIIWSMYLLCHLASRASLVGRMAPRSSLSIDDIPLSLVGVNSYFNNDTVAY